MKMLKYTHGGGQALLSSKQGAIRRALLYILMPVFCAGLFLGTVFLCQNNNVNAKALTSGYSVTVDELLVNNYQSAAGGKIFNGDNLAKLYDAILGSDYTNTGTYKKVAALTKDSSGNNVTVAGSSINNGNLVVKIGGLDWNVVYLSTVDQSTGDGSADNGDVILTLWLAGTAANTNVDNEEFARFANFSGSTNTNQYPTNMYGVSKVRAVYLNNGGLYTYCVASTDAQASATNNPATDIATQSESNKFAKFTMSALGGSANQLYDYIVAPANVHWQETERFADYVSGGLHYIGGISGRVKTDNSAAFPNDAYGAVSGFASGSDYTNKPNYSVWKDDKIWLPSATEVGYGNGTDGVWKCTTAQRTNSVSGYQNLRTGENDDYNRPVLMSETGQFLDAYGPSRAAVRPAFHLNLTKANQAIGGECVNTPQNLSVTYDGTEYTDLKAVVDKVAAGGSDVSGNTKWFDEINHKLTSTAGTGSASGTLYETDAAVEYKVEYKRVGATTYTTQTSFSVKDAGEYKITCNFEPNNSYKWRSPLTGVIDSDATKTFTITVKQCEVKYKWANIGLDGSWKATFAQTFTPATGASAAPWVYLNYTLPVSTENTASGGSGGTVTNDKIPYVVLTFTGTQSQFADYKITNIDNMRSATAKGSNYPKHADTYTVTFTDKNAATSNYKLVADSGESSTRTYTIERLKVDAPVAPTELTYNGADQSFANVPNFDAKFMTYGQMAADGVNYLVNATPMQPDGVTPKMTASVSAGKLTLTAKDADKYDIYYRLLTDTTTSGEQVVRDYMWKDGTASDPAPVKKVTYEIKAKTLEFTFASSSSSWSIKSDDDSNKLTYSYATGKDPVTGETPVLELYYYFNSDGETSAVKNSDSTELLFKDLKDKTGKHATGKYTVVIKLADYDDTTNTVNKNYCLMSSLLDGLTGSDLDAAKATYQKEVTLTAGEASLDDIKVVYKDSLMPDGDDPKEVPATLKYKYDTDGDKPVQYFFTLDFTDIDYLEVSGAYLYSYSDGTTLGAGEGFAKADTVKMTVTVKVKADKVSDHKMPLASDYTNGKFGYTRVSDSECTLTYEYKIDKGDVDADSISTPKLQYRFTGGSWTDYDPANPPEYCNKNIEVRVKEPYPQGVKSATVTMISAGKALKEPGSPSFKITYDVNENYNAIVPQAHTVTISAQIIDIGNAGVENWTDSDGNIIRDAAGVPFQIPVVNVSDPAYRDYIDYEYYLVDLSDPLNPKPGTLIGKGKDALEKLTDPAGSYKVSSNNALALYVKPVLSGSVPKTDSGTPLFGLKDVSGKTEGGFISHTLGESRDLAIVKLEKNSSVYGDGVDAASIVSVKLEDGSNLQKSFYTLTVYKGSVAEENKLGALSDFNFSTADAGLYIIVVELTDEVKNEDGKYIYALTESVLKYTVEKKEIELPTVGEIVFSGNYINLVDYLGGSYSEYKDIISISGDYLDIRNVSQSGYKARLVLNNPNYKWAQPSTAEPAGLKLFAAKLFDNELAILDDSTVELNWNIAPLVVDASEMWNKGKEGATLNLPENINALITGETLTIGYRYYDEAGQYIENPELAGGKSFRVEAIFGGIDADSGNVLFKTADGNVNAVSDKISYTVPQSGVAAFFGSTLNFLKANWLWFVIGAAVLLFLIILICIIAAAKKKKKRRLAEEKAERERREEERRLEREERMARMNQQQAAPQPQYIQQPMPQMMPSMMSMPQMQPQYMPQQVQPMTMPVGGGNGGGSVSEAQFMQMQAELATLKAEATLRAESAMRAEQQIAQTKNDLQFASIMARLGGEQVVQSGISNGITLDKLTELIRTEVNNAFDSREKAAVTEKTENGAASAAATQVPPDAVMTTVTTTKIDTTKKPVQNAQATAARPVVRNYVAPMPVDDGRVFDVGGFYKPADPVTDFNFDDEEDKN